MVIGDFNINKMVKTVARVKVAHDGNRPYYDGTLMYTLEECKQMRDAFQHAVNDLIEYENRSVA